MNWRKLWNTLHEPRAVTVLMVLVYASLAGVAVFIGFEHPLPGGAATFFSALFMGLGGVFGVPSAWRGAWWLEGVAAMACMVGLFMLAGLDLLWSVEAERIPGYPLILTIILALFFLTRGLRIWPYMYAPGAGPVTSEREQAARTELAVMETREAIKVAKKARE